MSRQRCDQLIVQAIEEGLEMTGVAIFLCALLDYANRQGIGISVRVDRDEEVAPVQ